MDSGIRQAHRERGNFRLRSIVDLAMEKRESIRLFNNRSVRFLNRLILGGV